MLVSRTAGSRNQEGFVNGLNRQGFTPDKCGAEILANSSDAFADNTTFHVRDREIIYVDVANGMTLQKFDYMFDAGRENHSGETSMGVSGIGGIISCYQLSKKDDEQPSPVTVYTKHRDGEYLKAVVPWDSIYRTKKYDGQIEIGPMSEDEIRQFIAERNNQAESTGTTIRFPYSERFNNLLDTQFKSVQTDCSSLEKLWSIIFGKIEMRILLNKNNGLPPVELKKYDYFGSPENAYYEGKFVWDIYCFSDNGKKRFVCKDPTDDTQYLEITQNANGFSKEPKQVQVDPRKIDAAETITFTSGMIKDNNVFDPRSPKEPTSAEFHLNGYDASFMKCGQQKDVIKEFASKVPIYRNNQRITSVPLDGFKVSSARAGGESLLKIVLHRAEISYKTVSTQENIMDSLHGIQQNKNQNQNDLPKQYTRLIEYLKNYDYQRITTYFKNVITAHKRTMIEQQQQRRLAEEVRQAEERRVAEELRLAEERRVAEERRIAIVANEEEDQTTDDGDEERNDVGDVNDEAGSDDEAGEHEEDPHHDDGEVELGNDEDDDEDDDDDDEDDGKSPIVSDSDSHDDDTKEPVVTESHNEENILLEVEDSAEETKQYILKSIQALSEHIITRNYHHIDGKLLYESIMNLIKN
jgi:hypothetical protein